MDNNDLQELFDTVNSINNGSQVYRELSLDTIVHENEILSMS